MCESQMCFSQHQRLFCMNTCECLIESLDLKLFIYDYFKYHHTKHIYQQEHTKRVTWQVG